MIVAAGASDGQTKKGLAEDIELVLDPVGVILLWVSRGVHGLVKIPKFVPIIDSLNLRSALSLGSSIRSPQRVRPKLIIRQVVIEGPNQIVPVFMGMLQWVIELVPASLGITHQVHPVTSPLFSEMGLAKSLSTTLSKASDSESSKKRDLIGIRGKPIRSKYTRLIQVLLSAGREGRIPRAGRTE